MRNNPLSEEIADEVRQALEALNSTLNSVDYSAASSESTHYAQVIGAAKAHAKYITSLIYIDSLVQAKLEN